VHEGEPALAHEAVGHLRRRVVVRPLLHHLGAERAHAGVLLGVVPHGHADDHRRAEDAPRVREAEAVVAARGRAHAAAARLRVERGERGERVAHLERARRLVVLVLHEHPHARAHRRVELGVVPQRRRHDVRLDALPRAPDVGQRDRHRVLPRRAGRAALGHLLHSLLPWYSM
jgi:hypothetical protein